MGSSMDPKEAADQIRGVIKRELDACSVAIEDNDTDTARTELEDAIRKLKRIAAELD
jgi:hypothetical protein